MFDKFTVKTGLKITNNLVLLQKTGTGTSYNSWEAINVQTNVKYHVKFYFLKETFNKEFAILDDIRLKFAHYSGF